MLAALQNEETELVLPDKVRIEFKPQDLWVGAYWQTDNYGPHQDQTTMWICLLPMLPIRISWIRKKKITST